MHGDEWKAGHDHMDADAWKPDGDDGVARDPLGDPGGLSGPPGGEAAAGRSSRSSTPRVRRPRGYWIWPVGLVCAFLLVVGVNVLFVYVAVSGADEVVESYATEAR